MTTAPAPTTVSAPIVTPGQTIAPRPSSVHVQPRRPAATSAGWHLLQNGLTAPPTESAAAAANVPFAAADRGQPTATPTPIHSDAHLPSDGIVIWAQFVPRGIHPTIDKNFPPTALPLRVAQATAINPPEGFSCPQAVTPARCFKASGGPAAERLRPGDPRAAARFTLTWLRTHYAVHARTPPRRPCSPCARIPAHPADKRLAEVTHLCGASTNQIVAVRVAPAGIGRPNLGPQLLYFLVNTSQGWLVWRQG